MRGYKEIFLPEAIHRCKNYCFENYKETVYHETYVYRGIPSLFNSYYWVDPKAYERVSVGSSYGNFHTLFMDNLPEWKWFPKRKNSMICSMDEHVAKSYGKGEVYIILPNDMAKFGVCSAKDVLFSFPYMKQHGIVDLAAFNSYMEQLTLLVDIELQKENIFSYTWNDLLKIFEYIKNNKESVLSKARVEVPPLIYKFIEKIGDGGLKYIEELMNPRNNGISLLNYSDLLKRGGSFECWTDADSLLIAEEQRIDFLKNMKAGNKDIQKEVISNIRYLKKRIDKYDKNVDKIKLKNYINSYGKKK